MSWQSAAVKELDRFTGKQATKKRETVIAIVDARLAGRSEETVWKYPNTCSRNTYHSSWKREEVFAEVLSAVTSLAHSWKSGEALQALQEAARRLALASPIAVTRAIEKMSSTDESVALRAALAILDRAGIETATKASAEINGNIIVKGYATVSPDDWDD